MSHEDQDELVELRELVVVYEDRIARYEDVIGGLGLQVGQLGGLCRSWSSRLVLLIRLLSFRRVSRSCVRLTLSLGSTWDRK